MINKTILLGRLGKDAERKTSANGVSFWKFSIATNEWISTRNEEETTWHNITCFNEYAGKQLDDKGKKGTLVYIEGKIQKDTYTNNEGQEVTSTNIVLGKFGSVLKIVEKQTGSSSSSGSSASAYASAKNGSDDFDDKIPF
jgi:single-strand DNA-binding protein